jgi:hypothetical protein
MAITGSGAVKANKFEVLTGTTMSYSNVSNITFAEMSSVSGTNTFKINNLSAYASNTDLTLTGNGTGTVSLPAGTKVGGVLIGTILLKGSVATSASLPGSATTGDAYIVLSPTPTHLWAYDGASFVDLGAFQGPAGSNGTNGQGVPTGGVTGQVLAKSSSTDYATTWSTPFSGAYVDLTGKPTIPTTVTINGTSVTLGSSGTVTAAAGTLTGTTLNSSVVTSSLTSVGTLTNLTVTNAISGSVTGNAGTVTDGVYTTGTYSNPAWITGLAYSKLSGAPTLATVATSGSYADLSNKPTIPAAYSATSIDALSDVDTTTSAPTNGQALVWNAAGSKWLPGTVSGGGGAMA